MNHAINGLVDTFLSHFPERKRDSEELAVRASPTRLRATLLHIAHQAWRALLLPQELDAKDTFTFKPKVTGGKRKRDDDGGGDVIDLGGDDSNSEDDDDYDDAPNSSDSNSDDYDSDASGSDDGDDQACRTCNGARGGFQCTRRAGDVHRMCTMCFGPFPTRAEYTAQVPGPPPPERCGFCLKYMCDAFWTKVDGAGYVACSVF